MAEALEGFIRAAAWKRWRRQTALLRALEPAAVCTAFGVCYDFMSLQLPHFGTGIVQQSARKHQPEQSHPQRVFLFFFFLELLRLKLKSRVWEQKIRMILKASSRYIFSCRENDSGVREKEKVLPRAYGITRSLNPR